ncbi:glycosyltransferase family 2 protein [Umezakia ovalisporum]|jgi:cellulose synthase/poly-beta-1,6-N-acetylglucosamine synthase-like glycosyltransferase|uniref:Glycosyltransferase family 2 protein n=2 Tax=Umezakia ovalisporum TaxID=75695 RepID=A0AA43KE94_9CYAN|nr:glycosyltransferase family 2 protein [Umezakia ovalisporum]MBI1243151.1 glycosyltransferase [Nostoc sp. RI_552]MDH6056835.1 glycosyltransferase family 2 protein [Umezakia ovalisporum FSS-43]MDH6063075.1 glycosyltransferase family 2 protein [Umezakia ovalisporum FSS-62]MDH6068686.1 glycosyltransferase family 2 protein [Umezakia ovalisporum APH033B]MDH6071795.1 glycosyltransferase family 2 protein [Umezakia ovalisporum CobakiLakeA]
MKELTIFITQSLLGWLTIQMCLALVFLFYVRSSRQQNLLADDQLPKTAVILCLRGADPYLPNCLEALFNQNYPEYDLKLIVDSQEDPAWQIVHDTIKEQKANNVQVSPLRAIRHNCSLKCSSLLQAVSDLDDSYKAIALVDSDTIVHANWLRELVSPLAHPQVGVVTGNRWFAPRDKYWGSLVRYIGNMSTVVQMYLFQVPWGGTLAIKTDLLRHTGLLDKWGQALGEDFMIHKIIKKHGMRVKFVPSLIMLNREECDLLGLIESLKRLLLYSRFYHPNWLAIVGDAISSILFPCVAIVLFLLSLLDAQWDLTILLFATYCIYTVGLLLLTLILELGVSQVIRSHGQLIPKLSMDIIGKILIAIPLTQWVYGLAFIASLWISTVQWRGIVYRVQNPWNIRLLEYHPYDFLDQPIDSKISL